MARNLYEMGDARSPTTDQWLGERDERSARVVPRGALLLALALGGTGLLLFNDLLPGDMGKKAASSLSIIDAFSACDDAAGHACVLSPGQFSYRGRSYRLSDVAAPSLIDPACPLEEEIAQKGRMTLLALMNGGAFEMMVDPADDSARILMRDGVSLGALLILKGYAKPATTVRFDWCAGKS